MERLTIAAILRDHQKSRARDEDYPPIPFIEQQVRVWSPEQAEEALAQRVRLHQMARQGEFPPCTPSERWAKPDVWAVRKKGNVRALPGGLHESEEAALAFAADSQHETEIEFRRGESVRCQDYCLAAPWCEQWAALRDEQPDPLDVFQAETRR